MNDINGIQVEQSWIVCWDGLTLAYRSKHHQWAWVKMTNPLRPELTEARLFKCRQLAHRRAKEHGGTIRLVRWFVHETPGLKRVDGTHG